MVFGLVFALSEERDQIFKNIAEKMETVPDNCMCVDSRLCRFDTQKITVKTEVSEYDIISVVSGVGKAYAAAATQHLVDLWNPDILLNIGVSANLTDYPEIKAGYGNTTFNADFDLTAFGQPKYTLNNRSNKELSPLPLSELAGTPLAEIFFSAVAEHELSDSFREIDLFAAGDFFLADVAKKEELQLLGAGSFDMESNGFMQAVEINEKDALIIKVFSDDGSDTADEQYESNYRTVLAQIASVVKLFCDRVSDHIECIYWKGGKEDGSNGED